MDNFYEVPTNIYTWINSLDSQTLIKYVIIISISLLIFRKIGVILALILATLAILYIHNKDDYNVAVKDNKRIVKQSHITPEPHIFNDKDDLVDFFFSVQDFYQYNPQAYEETINNLDSFFSIYNKVKEGIEFCEHHYRIAESKRRNALNSFHSIIHKLPRDDIIQDKFNRSHQRFDTILTKYINELYGMCKKDLEKSGYSTFNSIIHRGPKEYNNYNDEIYSYDFY